MYVAFDTETYLIRKTGKATTLVIPRLVCMSYVEDGGPPKVVARKEAVQKWKEWILNPDVKLIGHNVTFDVLVMTRALTEEEGGDWAKEIFNLYEKQRIHDTITYRKMRRIERIGDTGGTGYSLAYMAKKYLKLDLGGKSGDDVWRARYGELEGIPVEKYPKAAYQYAAMDAKVTWDLFWEMTKGKHYRNESFQLLGDLALYLQSAHGFMVDQNHVKWIRDHYQSKLVELASVLRSGGILRKNGSADTKKVKQLFKDAWASLKLPPQMTDSGKSIATCAKTLENLKARGFFDLEENTESIVLMRAYSEYKTTNKFISTYLEPLSDAGEYPVCTRYTTVVNSTRVSASSPNVQNFPAHLNSEERRKKEEGFEGPFGKDIRGCIVPRPGHVFLVADYSSIEMMALAQVCANINGGLTKMGKVLNSGMDPHIFLLTEMIGKPFEEVEADYKAKDPWTVRWRQIMKAANYAYMGGAREEAFVEYVKGYGERITVAEGKRAYDGYHDTWTEVRELHFRDADRYLVGYNDYRLELHGPKRVREGWVTRRCDRSTQAYNARPQGIVASGCKWAAWHLAKACYVYEDNVLYGDRPVLFVHDEFAMEVKDENIEAKGTEFSRIMVDSMKDFLPDMEVEAEWKVERERWSK